MMKRNIIVAIVSIFLIVIAAACGVPPEESTPVQAPETGTLKVTVNLGNPGRRYKDSTCNISNVDTVLGSVKWEGQEVPLTFEPVKSDQDYGVYESEELDLPLGKIIIFEAAGLNAQGTLIYKGSITLELTAETTEVVLSLRCVNLPPEENYIPNIIISADKSVIYPGDSVSIDIKIYDIDSVDVECFIAHNFSAGNLSYLFGNLGLVDNKAALNVIFESSEYTAGEEGAIVIEIRDYNGGIVVATVDISISDPINGVKTTVNMMPVITNIIFKKNNDGTTTVEALLNVDPNENELIYSWSGNANFIGNTENNVVKISTPDPNDSNEVSVSLHVLDAWGESTSRTFKMLPQDGEPSEVPEVKIGADDGVIEWSGRKWNVRYSSNKEAPGPNYYSDSIENIWVDEKDCLHLLITKDENGDWRCASVELQKSLGKGKYELHLKKGNLETNTVLTFNNWDGSPDYNHRNMGIVFYGHISCVIASYFINNKRISEQISSNSDSEHFFEWSEEKVLFESRGGDFTIGRSIDSEIPPPEGNEKVSIVFCLNDGKPLLGGKNQEEVIITKFIFEEL